MRLIFPKTSKRTSLWQDQTHWELMYFSWLWKETGKRDLYEGHRNINYKSRLTSSKYHTVKWLLFSSSQFSEQSKTSGALVWHICLPDPSRPWGSNPQAEEFPVSKMRSCLVWEHCASVKAVAQEIVAGETREGEEASFWSFMTIALCGRARHLSPELLMYFHQTRVEQSTLII